jgi:hypothetical protein
MKNIPTLFVLVSLLAAPSAVVAAGVGHHYPGIFMGYTHADSETKLTVGFEYEYKFNPIWGAGFVYEKADDAHHGDGITVKVAELFYHPASNSPPGIGAGREKNRR